MSNVPTRRQALLGTAAFSLSLGGVLVPASAFACHRYQSPDGTTGCAAYKRDQASGDSGSSDTVSEPQSPPSTDSGTNTDTQSGSGDPQVSGQTIRVSNGSQFENALGSAKAGNRIELADGSYSGNFLITNSGTSSAPILIEASNRLKAVLQSSLVLRGNHVIVSGLSFRGAGVQLRAHNCRVTRCYFNGSGTAISVRGADKPEIDRNEVTNWNGKGVDFDPAYERRQGYRPHIYRNYFHDSAGDNKNAAINIGQQARHHGELIQALVEYNLCVDIPRYKAVFCKSSRNTVRYNTLINCQGLVNRHGFENKYIGNWLEDTLDLIINDKNCIAEGNKLINAKNGLRVFAGDITSEQVKDLSGGHPRAEGCQIIENETGRITVGATYSSWSRIYPALNTVLRGNTGRISLSRESGAQISTAGQSSAGAAARKLQPSDVGPWS